MSTFQSDLENFDNLMESVSAKTSKPHNKVMLEAITVSNTRKILDEGTTKRKKDFQKKLKGMAGKKKTVIDAKKALKGLYESVLRDAGYVAETPAQIAFFEACLAADKALLEMNGQVSNELEQYYDLYKKYYDTGDLTPEEQAFLKNNDPIGDLEDITNKPQTLNPDFSLDDKKKISESSQTAEPQRDLIPEQAISSVYKKVGPSGEWNADTWLIGPTDNEDGSYYIYKENMYPYEILRLYKKETYSEHRKGDGKADFTEPVYQNQSYQDILAKAKSIADGFSKEIEAINEDATVAGGNVTSNVAPFYAKIGETVKRPKSETISL